MAQASQVQLTADAATGTGTPGTVFAGQGDCGGDAVVGTSTASDNAKDTLIASLATVALTKAAAIADQFGGTQPVPGAVVTYTLTATVSGTGQTAGLHVTDAIPAGTTYEPGRRDARTRRRCLGRCLGRWRQSGLCVGHRSGPTITNTVTVNYQVGGVSQTATGASNAFTVDRKVNLAVAEVGTTTTQVSPGQTAAVTTFTVTNTSNATLDFALVAAQQTGGAGAHSNTDTFDVSNVKIYVETGTVISDPLNGTTSPKAIPGAMIEYCIIVSNAAGSATASTVAINDPLPGAVTYDSTYGIFINDTATSGVCNADGSAGGAYTTESARPPLRNWAAARLESTRGCGSRLTCRW